ncbi:hypothetical protein K443DRAFT_116728 [Laccaria amethystina LaAM-08-1]|uniref:Uncharacterized protein n=1 Tax=Laccaria amethystina LaAM-08-1 TaxID=1095629 RepID=A0A0C9WH01_9AGAR|nr:hypothetical protein K443DRAFT_116728 [Laccaria amethystina LaAM-08-1]
MDFIPLDDCGAAPTIDFRHIHNDLWIGLNAPCDAIPSEASSPPHRLPAFDTTGPTGMLFEMEWALDADWFNPDAGWRPFLPKPIPESKEWFFHLEYSTLVDLETISQSGECSIHPSAITEMESDLRRFKACVVAITHSTTFPIRGCRPGYYNYESLCNTFDDNQALENFGANMKHQALDYLAFINWWISSVSFWDQELPQVAIDAIYDLDLQLYPRRGVLLNLQKDWRQINIPHLLRQRVPTYYKWNAELDKESRFLSISPTILKAFEDKQLASGDGKVYSFQMPEFAADFEKMKDYDEFFQERVFDGSVAPGIDFPEDGHYAVVDFQGWMYQPIPLRTAKEFVTRFGSRVVHYNGRTSVIFRRWEALSDEASISSPAGLAQEGPDNEVVRGHSEIREIHCSFYAPFDRQKFDLNGFPDYGPTRSNLNRLDSASSSHRASVNRPPRNWVEAITLNASPSTRSSSSGGVDRERNSSRNSARASPYPRPRSQSPSRRQAYQRRSSSPGTLQSQFVRRLCAYNNITGSSTLWSMPIGPSWNTNFLNEGIILFPDNRTQICLRYWAICGSGILYMRHVLELAICRGMKFILAIPYDALPLFHSAEPPSMMDLTKRTYDVGFQESPLTYDKGRVAFMDQYLGKLADILRRPHARAVIAMGGPTSWIARYYGGERLVAKYISGPSVQVTVHHRGGVANDSSLNMPVFYDQLSAQEVELIHGYVPLGSPIKDRWAFPTTEIFEDCSRHWRGEWNQGCEHIMGNIARDLGSGLLAPQTRKEWREYLRGNNRGEYAPEPGSVPTPNDFTLVESKIDSAFPLRWHGRRIRDIPLPEEFGDTASEN